MRILNPKNGTDYLKLIDSIDADLIRLEDQNSTAINTGRFFAIRHDIDDRFDHALKFGEFEQRHGLYSTYFVHGNRPYFKYAPEFAAKLRRFEEMGHAIGYHCDALARWKEGKGYIPEIVDRVVSFLKGARLDIRGSACHGSKICLDSGQFNYDIWLECPYPNRKNGYFRVALYDFGLEYEAYFLRRDAYLSDNHGGWGGFVTPDFYEFERPGVQDQSIMDDIINGFNALKCGMLQVLIHPQHWEIHSG